MLSLSLFYVSFSHKSLLESSHLDLITPVPPAPHDSTTQKKEEERGVGLRGVNKRTRIVLNSGHVASVFMCRVQYP